jgi:hypothetical protein
LEAICNRLDSIGSAYVIEIYQWSTCYTESKALQSHIFLQALSGSIYKYGPISW